MVISRGVWLASTRQGRDKKRYRGGKCLNIFETQENKGLSIAEYDLQITNSRRWNGVFVIACRLLLCSWRTIFLGSCWVWNWEVQPYMTRWKIPINEKDCQTEVRLIVHDFLKVGSPLPSVLGPGSSGPGKPSLCGLPGGGRCGKKAEVKEELLEERQEKGRETAKRYGRWIFNHENQQRSSLVI